MRIPCPSDGYQLAPTQHRVGLTGEDDAVTSDATKLACLHGWAPTRNDNARTGRVANHRPRGAEPSPLLDGDRRAVNRGDLAFEHPATAVPSGQYARPADLGDRAAADLGVGSGGDHYARSVDVTDHAAGDRAGSRLFEQQTCPSQVLRRRSRAYPAGPGRVHGHDAVGMHLALGQLERAGTNLHGGILVACPGEVEPLEAPYRPMRTPPPSGASMVTVPDRPPPRG